MSSKLRKAIGAVKDQTSISLAKVSSYDSNLGIAILKATTHDEFPADERHIHDILNLLASDKAHARACASTLGKRIGRTRNWIVVLKCLTLILKIFQDGDPYFPREVFHAMKQGTRILNLSNFRDDSNSSPWDYTAFVRTFALYLDERLDCILLGKVHKRFARNGSRVGRREGRSSRNRRDYEPVRDMKPALLLDRISFWQKLLDRAIATQPTGAAKMSPLVRFSLHAVVRESFDLYRDISDGLALLLDSFFHLRYQSCVAAFQACVRSLKQFTELCDFYEICKGIGVGRSSEYPSVQKISDELVETLQEFLRDQASFPGSNAAARSPRSRYLALRGSGSEGQEAIGRSEIPERGSDWGSRRRSLEDLISDTDADAVSNPEPQAAELPPEMPPTTPQATPPPPPLPPDDLLSDGEGFIPRESKPSDCWEMVLFESASQERGGEFPNDQPIFPEYHNNPFLQDAAELIAAAGDNVVFPANNAFASGPNLQVLPTFRVREEFQASLSSLSPTFRVSESGKFTAFTADDDPFEAAAAAGNGDGVVVVRGPFNQNKLLLEQQLWLENQSKIIAKRLC